MDDEGHYTRKTQSLHYGSLEEQERQRSNQTSSTTSASASDAIQAGIAAGNINISSGKI